ncbi:transaldolase family protein [Tessaracoccus sp. Z1128]
MTAPAIGRPSLRSTLEALGAPPVRGEDEYVARVARMPIDAALYRELAGTVNHVGVTDEFRAVVDHFGTPAGHTPAGFRVELERHAAGVLRADLVRDISRDVDGVPRPTKVLLSADTANPYELAPIAPLVANLTCNPGIIYDLFINNESANVGHKFHTRDEVMGELGRILGPGADISVELNNPFDPDFERVLAEAEAMREVLSRWRVVIKVPHTGPVNGANVEQLLGGSTRLTQRWWEPATRDAFLGHDLALRLRDHGFRVNFTLMFEPHQALLALQAKPAFINSFVRHRLIQTQRMAALLEEHSNSGDESILEQLRDYMIASDMLAEGDDGFELSTVRERAEWLVRYRRYREPEGSDGLDCVRHNLRVLRAANLPETRLIICSMEGDSMYPDIDRLLTEPEFTDMTGQVVVTAEPRYLARFASASLVVSYQRRFMKAARSAPTG